MTENDAVAQLTPTLFLHPCRGFLVSLEIPFTVGAVDFSLKDIARLNSRLALLDKQLGPYDSNDMLNYGIPGHIKEVYPDEVAAHERRFPPDVEKLAMGDAATRRNKRSQQGSRGQRTRRTSLMVSSSTASLRGNKTNADGRKP